ncbi:NitT/TauT family transport system permease protein [Paraburkholderia sp. HC6.4b]|uniref:ABC transporter permease n=1 Tax=unclassified Paraburkholderia TaxID=2615204 RepID=UPI00161218B9|nr:MULTISPECIES: ABC transporter permease subunit [unclassified Paraburkholderia]MBB5406322.1 NitT/TauT family transport system permease protein [Paraburkholderia sp. HC6.4b]MBB5448720.1 NitT/TauT family transport system permease protein [Paraburkholderia sp. Kb1A]
MAYRVLLKPGVHAWRLLLIAALFGLMEWCSSVGWVNARTMPPPSEIITSMLAIARTEQFRLDIARTGWELLASTSYGVSSGLAIGTIFALNRTSRMAFEPFVVTLYAIPLIVFYPVMMVVMGIGAGPVIAITAVMVAVPVALNTAVAISSIHPRFVKMALSVGCSRARTLFRVVIPASGPVLFSGIKLGFMYGIIGVIGMEFILSDSGIGFRIGYEYANFAVRAMWGYIGFVVVLSIGAVAILESIERWLRKDLTGHGSA